MLVRLQYVAQYPAGTSIWPLKTKTQFLRRSFQFSVNEVFRMKAEGERFGESTACKTVAEGAVLFRWVNFSWLIFAMFAAQKN